MIDLFDPVELREAARASGLDDSPASLLEVLVGAAQQDEPERREWTLRCADGDSVPVDLVVTRRRLVEPGPDGYLFVANDLTERRESERLQDEFVGLVSHELRTPLSSILGYLDLLRVDAGLLPAEDLGYLGVIERNAHRLLRLVDDLLLSVQVVAETFTLTPEPSDATEIVRRSLEALGPAAIAKGVDQTLSAAGPVPLVTDPHRYAQVVENMLVNSIKFTPPGGTVVVTVTALTDGRSGARLVVSDSGPGMTAEEIDRATARFFRSEDARRQRVRGLGLGLAIVDAVVQAHAGTMSISSEPGAGTTITVDLPDLTPTTPE